MPIPKMKPPALKKPKFGGKRKTSATNAPKKVLEQWGPVPKKASGTEDPRTPGNREFGFIQSTPEKATGAMMGMAPPKVPRLMGAKPQGKKATKQFKAKAGRKVF